MRKLSGSLLRVVLLLRSDSSALTSAGSISQQASPSQAFKTFIHHGHPSTGSPSDLSSFGGLFPSPVQLLTHFNISKKSSLVLRRIYGFIVTLLYKEIPSRSPLVSHEGARQMPQPHQNRLVEKEKESYVKPGSVRDKKPV